MSNIMKRNQGNGNMTTALPSMPFGGLVNSTLGNTLSRFFDDDFWGFNGIASSSQVPVNIRETDKSYEMEVVAPGLSKEAFHVNITENILSVSFEHSESKEDNKGDSYLRQEYRMRSFSRSFTLDETINAEKISAQYHNGVLHLNLPKKEDAQKITKSIEVR